jgi:hypothetical protein
MKKIKTAAQIAKDIKRKQEPPGHATDALNKLCKAMIDLGSYQFQMNNLQANLVKSKSDVEDIVNAKGDSRLPCLRVTLQDGEELLIPVVINIDHNPSITLHECIGVEIDDIFLCLRDIRQHVLPFLTMVVDATETAFEEGV